MTDYYSLIAAVVADLDNTSVAERLAVYERARTTLMGLLTSSDPPLTHDQAQQQRAALEQAIRTVEAESVAQRAESNPVAQSPPPLSGQTNEVAVSRTEGRADTPSTAALADGGHGVASSEEHLGAY